MSRQKYSGKVIWRWLRGKRWWKVWRRGLGILALLFLVLLGALSSTDVQTRLAQYATGYFGEKLDFEIRLERLSLDLRGNLVLNDVYIGMPDGQAMIEAQDLRVDIAWELLLRQGDFRIEYISLKEGFFDLILQPEADEFNINLFIRAIEELAGGDTTQTDSSAAPFRIDGIYIENVTFRLKDPTEEALDSGQFDPANIELRNITGEATQFYASNDTIQLQAYRLSFYEPKADLFVPELTTFYRLCRKGMDFEGLRLQIGESLLRDTLRMRFDGYKALSSFVEQVELEVHLDSSFLTTRDLSKFLPALSPYHDAFRVSGKASGTIASLNLSDLSLQFGMESHLQGKAHLIGLPEIERTFMRIELERSSFYTRDLKTWLGLREDQNFLELGRVRFRADFTGLVGDFVADGTFDTDYGRIVSDINLKLNQQTYSGRLKLIHFALGSWLGNPEVGEVSLGGTIQGSGLNQKAANFALDARVDSIEFRGYNYRNITLDGKFEQEAFQGKVLSHDPNLELAADGKIDLSDSTFRMSVDTLKVDFYALKLSPVPLRLFTTFEADFSGLDPDQAVGTVGFDSLYLAYNEQTDLELDTLSLTASGTPSETRYFRLLSDIMHAELSGNFTFARLFRDFSNQKKLYDSYLSLPPLAGDSLAQLLTVPFPKLLTGSQEAKPYRGDFQISVYDAEPLTLAFIPDWHFPDTTRISGSFQVNDTLQLKLSGQANHMRYQTHHFDDLDLRFEAQKARNRPDINAQLFARSKTQEILGTELQDLQLEAQLQHRTIDFGTRIHHRNSDDSLRLNGNFSFADTANWYLQLASPELRLFGTDWRTTDSTTLRISGRELMLKNTFLLESGKRFVRLSGGVSEDPAKDLQVQLSQIDLKLFRDYLDTDIGGELSLEAELNRFYDTLHIKSEINIRDISVNQRLFGSLEARSDWNEADNAIDLKADFLQGRSVIHISGGYAPGKDKLNLDTEFVGLRLQPLEAFTEGLVSDIQGKAYGAVKVQGRLAAPRLSGELFLTNGGLRIDYLNTFYRFEDKINIEEDRFSLDRFKIRDANGQTAYLDGGLYHSEFKAFLINLEGEMTDFLVLNTTKDTEEAYYGQAIGTGEVFVGGDLSHITIEVDAKVGKNTRLFLPLDGYEGVEVRDFIRFVREEKDSLSTEVALTKRQRVAQESETDLSIELNLEITEYAYAEIIFDRRSGDVIRGYSQGDIEFTYSSKGDFSMFGEVSIVKGAYNFTFLNVVNKRFDVKPGSRITWAGDPYKAQLNLTAEYEQYASLAPILGVQDSSARQNNALQRKYPVEVDLQLKGDLYNPNLSFAIDFPEYPPVVMVNGLPLAMQGEIAAFKTRIQNDQQELNRQVFSLIVLRRLAEENTFEGVNQSAGSSVSELLTNQLSYWVSQVDERLEVDLDLQGLNSEALSGAQLRLSYSFLDGRVRITREGGFTNVQNQADLSSIAGDWTLEYIITQDGRFRAKVYHKNNLSNFSSALGNTSTAGVSLLQTYSFDKLSEVFRFKRKKPEDTFRDNEIRLDEPVPETPEQ